MVLEFVKDECVGNFYVNAVNGQTLKNYRDIWLHCHTFPHIPLLKWGFCDVDIIRFSDELIKDSFDI